MKYGLGFDAKLAIGTVDFDKIIVPALSPILSKVNGKKVLDLGCGSGRFSRLFALHGANVIAIDKDERQIARAVKIKEKDAKGIQFLQQDFLNGFKVASEFDLTLLMFVILDLPTSDQVERTLDLAANALTVGGRVLIADVHPHNFNRPNEVESVKSNLNYFRNGAPTASDVLMIDGTLATFKPNYHYRLDFLISTLGAIGFLVDWMLEPEFKTEFPTHLIISARKV